MSERFENTEFGFNWGAAEITRCFSDPNEGWITLLLKTPREEIQIYVTKTGKVRVHGRTGEWTKPKKRIMDCKQVEK